MRACVRACVRARVRARYLDILDHAGEVEADGLLVVVPARTKKRGRLTAVRKCERKGSSSGGCKREGGDREARKGKRRGRARGEEERQERWRQQGISEGTEAGSDRWMEMKAETGRGGEERDL